VIKGLRANAAAYGILACLVCFVGVFQVRISLETIHVERYLDFYVPFTVRPFTDRVDEPDGFLAARGSALDPTRARIEKGEHLVSVNGRPFRGMSVYLGEMMKVRHHYQYP
jgi:hypothetical protein